MLLTLSTKALRCLLLVPAIIISTVIISPCQPYAPPPRRILSRHTQNHYFDYCSINNNCVPPIKRQTTHHYLSSTPQPPSSSSPDKNNPNFIEINENDLYMERFRRRLQETRLRQAARIELLPPNPAYAHPCDFVTTILNELRRRRRRRRRGRKDTEDGRSNENDDDDDDANYLGLYVLLRSSTPEWRNVMHRSVGAPLNMDQDSVTAVLRSTLGRSNNQFNILLGKTKNVVPEYDDDNGGGSSSSSRDVFEYTISFPNDPVDYDDGMCWIECRLRCVETDDLLVAMGWTFQKRKEDGAWLVHNIDWQDFRDQFRPGIGREEWERICG